MKKYKRPETGLMEFEEDWCGVFIRGDNAIMGYGPALNRALATLREHESAIVNITMLEGLRDLLMSAEQTVDKPVQQMKPFSECFIGVGGKE